jgi:hypothetical protein
MGLSDGMMVFMLSMIKIKGYTILPLTPSERGT